jgi:hypothetical protein
MPPLPRRRDDRQPTRACPPSRTPALTSAPPNTFSPQGTARTILRRQYRASTTAPASRPSGRYAVGLRPSLDPDADLDVCAASEDSPKLVVTKVLTGPAPTGMTCGNAGQGPFRDFRL